MKRKSIWIFAAVLALLVMGCDDNEPTDQVDGITLLPSECRIAPGEKVSIWAQTWPDIVDYTEITWSSSNEAVATANSNGWVEAVSEGKATITANTYGKEATCEVTVCDHSWSDLKCTKCEIKMYIENGSINDEGVLTKYTGSEAEVVIPEGVTGIGSYAFKKDYGNSWLTSVVIPDTVTSIGDGAFEGCSKLTSVTIPNGVESIGSGAFSGCTSLIELEIPGSVKSIKDSATYNEKGAFSGCTKLKTVTINDGVESIGSYAFSGCTSLASVTIPDSVTEIGESAFKDCTSLASVTIPGSVKSIEKSAFYKCTRLTIVTIGEGVASIESIAFFECTSLESVTIPASVTKIGSSTFYGCTSLKSVNYGGTQQEWENINRPESYGGKYADGLSGKTITEADGKTWTAQ